jgi:long-chain acyl-CoA synthetase|tara:strand:- start:1170 stop:2729 length:1560 start_codon:yes stop_codon:yes gene_type:complete
MTKNHFPTGGRLICGAREISQDEVMARARRAASGFDRLGVRENQTVAFFLRNDFAFIEAALGANMIGAYGVAINWHFTAEEAGYVLRDCAAKVLVVHADLLPQIDAGLPEDLLVLTVTPSAEIRAAYGPGQAPDRAVRRTQDWETFLSDSLQWSQPPRAQRANIIYTSGTTGRPKGVRRPPSDDTVSARVREVIATSYGIHPGEPLRTIITGPMYHSVPNIYGLHCARTAGSLVVLQPRFDAEDLLRLIQTHRITNIHLVPTMFVRLLNLPEAVRRKYDLSSLKRVVHGAAPCPPDIKRRMIDWWGEVINEYYGATETGPAVYHTSQEALRKPGTAGKPLPWATVKALDPQGAEVPNGEIGEIFIRIADYPRFTYLNRPEETAAVKRGDLVTVGDLGYFDADGYLFLCDRAKEMIISGGVNIYPAEIESVLMTLPGVADCAVFGIPHAEFGETVCAHIQRREQSDVSEQQVTAFLAARIAKYKLPRVVVFEDRLPREDSGKIFKKRLRQPYWDAVGRQI